MQREGKGPRCSTSSPTPTTRGIHYETTGPEIWRDTAGRVTHFVSAMGTTGTITGTSRFLRGAQRTGARDRSATGRRLAHPGIRKWPARRTCRRSTTRPGSTRLVSVSQPDAETHGAPPGARGRHWRHLGGRRLLAGAADGASRLENATIVFIVCDRATATSSTGVFPGMTRLQSSARSAPPLNWHHLRATRTAAEGAPALRQACEWTTGTTRRRCWRPWSNASTARAASCWRATPPGRRMFALITGFMEAGETPRTASRARSEETAARRRARKPDRRLRLPAHEPGHHRLPRGGARRGRLSPELAEYKLFARGGGALLAGRHRATRWPTGCARHQPQFIELPPRRRIPGSPAMPPTMDAQTGTRHPRAELPAAAHPEGQEGPGGHAGGDILKVVATDPVRCATSRPSRARPATSCVEQSRPTTSSKRHLRLRRRQAPPRLQGAFRVAARSPARAPGGRAPARRWPQEAFLAAAVVAPAVVAVANTFSRRSSPAMPSVSWISPPAPRGWFWISWNTPGVRDVTPRHARRDGAHLRRGLLDDALDVDMRSLTGLPATMP